MGKYEVFKEFDKKFVYTELEDNPDSIIDSLEVIEHLNDDIFPFEIKQFIKDLIDKYEKEKLDLLKLLRKETGYKSVIISDGNFFYNHAMSKIRKAIQKEIKECK